MTTGVLNIETHEVEYLSIIDPVTGEDWSHELLTLYDAFGENGINVMTGEELQWWKWVLAKLQAANFALHEYRLGLKDYYDPEFQELLAVAMTVDLVEVPDMIKEAIDLHKFLNWWGFDHE